MKMRRAGTKIAKFGIRDFAKASIGYFLSKV